MTSIRVLSQGATKENPLKYTNTHVQRGRTFSVCISQSILEEVSVSKMGDQQGGKERGSREPVRDIFMSSKIHRESYF